MQYDAKTKQALLAQTPGARLRELRKVAGLTITDACARIKGMSRKTLGEIERDAIERSGYLPALCEAYGVDQKDVLHPDLDMLTQGMSIGAQIEARRRHMGYRRGEFAELVGCPYNVLYGIERRGKNSRHIARISAMLGMNGVVAEGPMSDLLREIRVSLLISSEEMTALTGRSPAKIEEAEGGDETVARQIILELCHGLQEGRHAEIMGSTVVDVQADGSFAAGVDGDLPNALRLPDGRTANIVHGMEPEDGQEAIVVTMKGDSYLGMAGTYRHSSGMHEIVTQMGRHRFKGDDIVHLNPIN